MTHDYHIPVMCREIVETLTTESHHLFCDVTLGDGGHSEALLQQSPQIVVIGIDRDSEAVQRARIRLESYGERFTALHGNFAQVRKLLMEQGIAQVDGIVCDLGVSQLQISQPRRGFMYSASGPLDMRMQQDTKVTAKDIVNRYSQNQLTEIIRKYGEERQARRIAEAIVKARKHKPINRTNDLADIVRSVVGDRFVIKSLARVFQSFRIVLNNELGNLETFLPQTLQVLRSAGRLAIIEYHSLESRIIKSFIYSQTHPCTCPKDLPKCVCGKVPGIKVVHRLVKPGDEELKSNPGSRSARLRVVEKL